MIEVEIEQNPVGQPSGNRRVVAQNPVDQTRKNLAMLSFKLAGQHYACELQQVREVRQIKRLTRVAGMPDYVAGVVSLRGEIVPIISLKKRFELPHVDELGGNKIAIITDIDQRVIGFEVDEIIDVISVDPESIKPLPRSAFAIAPDYLVGMIQDQASLSLVLNTPKLLSQSELHGLDKRVAKGST